ncbi:MAG: hypothetical protein J6B60_02590 [Clostridia bacterium]|nr:hypothetical protein [Clostridia bacterium]
MPKKLNDIQIAELIMKYTNGTSISALAAEYRIGWRTAKQYITDNKEMAEKTQSIKNESITEWLNAQKGTIMGILDQIIELLPNRLNNASVKELMGAYKILTETSIGNAEGKQGQGAIDNEQDTVEFIFTDTSMNEEEK